MDKETYEYYGDIYETLEGLKIRGLKSIDFLKNNLINKYDIDPIEHYKCRIKSVDSLKCKLQRKNLPTDVNSALENIKDIVGFRVVCTFLGEIFKIVDEIKNNDEIEVLQDKDYINRPKPNGYRSYHLILKFRDGVGSQIPFELQLRTISMDSWASLEHKLKYKRDVKNENLIVNELKRCADEMASTDLSMQTIHDLIKKS